jgi:hypothetical protein
MVNSDLCKRSTPRVELDQRARDARLGLERIERLLARYARPMMLGSGKGYLPIAGTHGERPPHTLNSQPPSDPQHPACANYVAIGGEQWCGRRGRSS